VKDGTFKGSAILDDILTDGLVAIGGGGHVHNLLPNILAVVLVVVI